MESMDNVNLKQYPSGFLGSSTTNQTKKDDSLDTRALTQRMFNKPYSNSKIIDHTSNDDINSLWSKVLENTDEVKEFEFKGKVLKAALEAFGTITFVEWLDTQSSSPEYGEYQQKFVDETINFIYYGKRRNLTFANWVALLRSDSISSNPIKKYSETQEIFLKGINLNRGSENKYMFISDLIRDWTSQPNGINDLTSSLYVLFGSR